MRIGLYLISLILGILAIIAYFSTTLTVMTGVNVHTYTSMIPVHSFWLAFVAWLLLIIRR